MNQNIRIQTLYKYNCRDLFYDIYCNILGITNVLVHLIEPNTWFKRGVTVFSISGLKLPIQEF